MSSLFYWLYLTNLVLWIMREWDAARRQEWSRRKLPAFLRKILRREQLAPGTLLLLYGVILVFFLKRLPQVVELTKTGEQAAFLMALTGLWSFLYNRFLLEPGEKADMTTNISSILLYLLVLISLIHGLAIVWLWP